MSISQHGDLLLKKFLGTVDAYPGISYGSEAAGNARPFVFSSQILSKSIPSSASSITDLSPPSYLYGKLTNGSYGNITLTTSQTSPTDRVAIGTIQTSTLYPIQKITCILSPVGTSGISYRFADPSIPGGIPNYLNQVIPQSFDASGSYNYILKGSNNNDVSYLQNTIQWYIDTDAGYLYFPNGDWNTLVGPSIFPQLTFYRYNGNIGGDVVLNTNSISPISLSGSSQASPIMLNLPSTLSGAYNCSAITGTVYIDFSGGISNSSYIFYIPNCTSTGQIIFTSFSVLSNVPANISTPYVISPSSTTTCNVIMVVTVYNNNMYHVALSSYNTPDITTLTTAQITSLSSRQLNSLTQFQVANLSSQQITSLSSTQINSLTSQTSGLFTTAQKALFVAH